jgi:nitrogen-specific signal transduction histidine kinase
MNSEMNTADASSSRMIANHGLVVLDSSSVQTMRHQLHELANVFTGVMIAGGLLSQYLEAGSLQHYATDISENGERGCALVRELRSRLLAACGEAEVVSPQTDADGSMRGQ